MKKRLLLMALAVVCAVSSFAYNVNDYVYTATQRVKITGENLVTDGNFPEGIQGWSNGAGDSYSSEVWTLEAGVGPAGENVVVSQNGATSDAALCRAWSIQGTGTYLVSYDIKGETSGVTGLVTGNSNCVDIFLNGDGALTKVASTDEAPVINVSTVDGFKAEWKTNAYVFNAVEGQYLVMHLEKLTANTMITNIQIYPVDVVYDDRILKNKLAYADRLIATGKFTQDTENDFLSVVVDAMRGLLEDPQALDDPSDAEALVAAYDEELLAWLDLNAADILKDEKKWSAYGDTRKQNSFGTWTGGGGRWFHKNNGGSSEITADGDEIGHRYQGGVEGNAYIAYPLKPNNAGTYMFSIDVVGHYMAGSSGKNYTYLSGTTDNYVTDWNRDFKGVTVYAGKDQMKDDAEANATMNAEQEGQKVDCGNINNPNAKVNPQKFVVFYDVTQEMVDAGEQVWFGMTYVMDPDRGSVKLGSNVNIANPQIRLIGVTQDAIDYQNEVAKIKVQQNAIAERYTWIEADLAKTVQEGYPWGKARLDSIAKAHRPDYEASLTVIDAEGNVLDEAKIKEFLENAKSGEAKVYSDSLLSIVTTLNSARSTYSNTNKPIADYRTKISDAEVVYADEFYAVIGDRTTFRAAIDAAIAKLDEILAVTNDETRDADLETMNAQLATLAEAVEAYKKSGEMTPIIDIDFSNNFETVDNDGTTTYLIKGAKGEMNFTYANPENTNVDKEMSYCKGFEDNYTDVLRVGSAESWVNIAEADQPGADEVLRVSFDMWSNRLSGKSIIIELRNAADQRIAGFKYDPYDNTTSYNDFDNAAGTGMKLNLNTSFLAGTAGDTGTLVDAYKTSFTLIVDYKAQAVQGTTVTTKGTFAGELVPIRTVLDDGTTAIEDNKIAKFVLSSDYATYQGRRCWFDNLKAYKYNSFAEGPIDTGIKSAKTFATDGTIYNLNGQKVMNPGKGLYIINGKKVVLK